MYKRVLNVGNKVALDAFVQQALSKVSAGDQQSGVVVALELLDVGAGSSPYRKAIEKLGMDYKSHDFNLYIPSEEELGLQDSAWPYADHTYVCDILEIPSTVKFDVVLCTEVLEHVPDPAAAFNHIANLVKPGGKLIVTVPFMSLMHQAPYWFSSGLSPFWFEYHSKIAEIEIIDLGVNGDYIDFLNQEFIRFTGSMLLFKPISFISSRFNLFKPFRWFLPAGLLECGGFTVTFVGEIKVIHGPA